MTKEEYKPLSKTLEWYLIEFKKNVDGREFSRAESIISLMINPVMHSCVQSERFVEIVIRDKGGCNTFIELVLAYRY